MIKGMRLAAVQAAPVFLDLEGSVEKACALIAEAGAGGADIVGFPEGFIPGHPIWYDFRPATSPESFEFAARLAKNSVEIPSAATERLAEAVRDAGVFVVMGLCERDPNRRTLLYNVQLFFNPDGTIAGRHRKLIPTVGERLVHTSGDLQGMRAYPFGEARVSGLICGENSNPLASFYLDTQGTNVHVASWPPGFYPGAPYREITQTVTRGFAYQTKAFVINALGECSDEMLEQVPTNAEQRAFLESESGGSTIIGPWGQVLAGPLEPGEGILYADVSFDDQYEPKWVHDYAGHYNRFDLFRLAVQAGGYPNVTVAEPGDEASSPTVEDDSSQPPHTDQR